ncbi:hypothetical protein ENSA5_44470 [Enhygromyxa salina]|uniref:DUF1269 domain-containing protein n=1 Tax=Enhygromyxa salina TaxID=215803 RepID=A0A2S9XKC3_9BACT|nr:hypothetical protein [Enhygromyxa salina]PRP93180.1 hypothetical protein ENSA5_44470 [Enhygromyxa salina]
MGAKKRHVYALFEDREAAEAAFEEVQQRGCRGEHCSALMQRDLLDDEELTMSETAAKEGAKKGALAAGVAGALVAGVVALPGGLLGFGPLVAAAFGAAWGATFGAMLGSISGASDPDEALRKIEAEVNAGKILIAVETDADELEEAADEVFASHGGRKVE